MRFSISGEIIRRVSRPSRPRVQTSALLGRFNLDVSKQNRAACFHDLGGANAAEDTINKTHAVNNCAGKLAFNHRGHRGSRRQKAKSHSQTTTAVSKATRARQLGSGLRSYNLSERGILPQKSAQPTNESSHRFIGGIADDNESRSGNRTTET